MPPRSGWGRELSGPIWGEHEQAGLSWPLPDTLSDDDLELLLFPAAPSVTDGERPVPDWSLVDRELRRPGVTRALLWEEYRSAHPLASAIPGSASVRGLEGSVRPTIRQRMSVVRRSSSTSRAT